MIKNFINHIIFFQILNILYRTKEDLIPNNKKVFFHSANALINVAIKIETATPLIPYKGTNRKFKITPIINEIPAHVRETFSFPLMRRISPADPKIELIIGASKIIKNVILGIKKSSPKNKIINFL